MTLDARDCYPGVPAEFWRVYSYIAKNWYEGEYGKIEIRDRWYGPTMIRLEELAYEIARTEAKL